MAMECRITSNMHELYVRYPTQQFWSRDQNYFDINLPLWSSPRRSRDYHEKFMFKIERNKTFLSLRAFRCYGKTMMRCVEVWIRSGRFWSRYKHYLSPWWKSADFEITLSMKWRKNIMINLQGENLLEKFSWPEHDSNSWLRVSGQPVSHAIELSSQQGTVFRSYLFREYGRFSWYLNDCSWGMQCFDSISE